MHVSDVLNSRSRAILDTARARSMSNTRTCPSADTVALEEDGTHKLGYNFMSYTYKCDEDGSK